MVARIAEKGAPYQGIKASELEVTPSKKHEGKVEISGQLGIYFFETIAVVTKKECQFYTLSIEGMFRLHVWLADHTAIKTAMDELKLKY